MDDVSEGRRAFGPRSDQCYGSVKVPDVVSIHPQEGCVLQERFTQTRAFMPSLKCSKKIFLMPHIIPVCKDILCS